MRVVSLGSTSELETLLLSCPDEAYVLNLIDESKIPIVWFEHATGEDLIRGMLHAHLLRHHNNADDIASSHEEMKRVFPSMLREMKQVGWRPDLTNIESRSSYRLSIESQLD